MHSATKYTIGTMGCLWVVIARCCCCVPDKWNTVAILTGSRRRNAVMAAAVLVLMGTACVILAFWTYSPSSSASLASPPDPIDTDYALVHSADCRVHDSYHMCRVQDVYFEVRPKPQCFMLNAVRGCPVLKDVSTDHYCTADRPRLLLACIDCVTCGTLRMQSAFTLL